MAFNFESQRNSGRVKNDITIVYLSWRKKSCVVKKQTSKNLSQKLFGDVSLWNWYKKWHITCVFLNGDLYEETFMLQLEGFVVKSREENFKGHSMTWSKKSNMVFKNKYLLSKTWND